MRKRKICGIQIDTGKRCLMKRVLLRSVYDAFEYVMDHYYPKGLEEYAKLKDSYAVISIQDPQNGGFGFEFRENRFCKGVLTLYFDDAVKEGKGTVLFTKEMAESVISFIESHKRVNTLLVHCYAGQSRSRAVAAFAVWMLKADNKQYFEKGSPNIYVYDLLKETYAQRQKRKRS